MRVDARFVPDTACRQPETGHGPEQIVSPVGAAQRQAFAERGFVDLDHGDARGFQVGDLIPDGQGDLAAHHLPRQIVAHERPLQYRDGSGQHPLHRAGRSRPRIRRPAHGHRTRTGHVAPDDRRRHAAAAIGLHPPVLGEGEPVQLLAEILHHVVAFELAVHQHVQPDVFLPAHRLVDPRLDLPLIRRFRHPSLGHGRPGLADLGRLWEGADGRRREQRQAKPGVLRRAPMGKRAVALFHVRRRRRQARADVRPMNRRIAAA